MRSSTLLRGAMRAVLGLALAAPLGAGHAQTAPAEPSVSVEGAQLEAVVVTARRRTENLQDVPVAVTAISAETLALDAVTNLADLNSYVPNMKIATDRATSSTINVYIRGVGQSDPLWGFEPGVGVYIDDVYLARPQAALLDVLDVDRVEVLRGPQGTLYGKNTIAGAIKYVTRDIAGPATLTVSATGGNYGAFDGKLSFSTPVFGDHVFFGAAVADLRHDGYGHVVAQEGTTPSAYNSIGQDLSSKDVLAARANVTAVWGESSKLRIVADTTQDNSHASGGQRLNDFLAPALPSSFDTRTDMPVDKDFFYRDGVAGTYTQTLQSGLDLKVVGAYREGHGRQFIDFEELNANLFQVPGHYRDRQGSGEGQLTFANDLVKAVGGVFYMDSTACGTYNASIGLLAAPPPAGFGLYLTSVVDGCVETKSTAVYADTVWKLTDRVNLDAGLRWNQDKKTASVYQAQYASVAPNQLLPNQSFTPGSPPAGFFLFPSAAAGVLTDYTNSRTFPNTSPRLGLDYHVTDHVMTYVSYAKGFKSGGFDMRGNATLYPETTNGYDSETADSFEAGVKSTLLDNTLMLNLTLFYDPYKDVQVGVQQFVTAGGVPQNVTAVLNAGKQMNKGVELESVWRPVRELIVGLNVGYLDAYYEDFLVGCTALTPGCNASSPPINIADQNRPINAPTWTVSASAGYTWMIASGELLTRLGYDWRSFTKVANTTPSVTDQPEYGLLNANLSYTTANKAWRFSVDGKNLTDKAYRVAGYDFGGVGTGLVGGVSQIGFYGPPRTYSATVQYHF